MFSPEHGGNVKRSTDAEEEEANGQKDNKDDDFPQVTRSHVTHSLYRRTAYVTRICAHVTDTAAVAVFLDNQNSLTLKGSKKRSVILHLCNTNLLDFPTLQQQ